MGVEKTNYQSYQSGIETLFRQIPTRLTASINRTKVELKRQHEKNIKIIKKCYQSYQSGIETKYETLYEKGTILSIVPKWNWNYYMLG